MTAPDIIKQLVERFEQHRESYQAGKYNETQLRREFLDPFFEALGWDVFNKHILFCLEGELHPELKDGRKFVLKPDQSYQVADNAEPHRSFTELHTPTTQIGVDKV